MSVTARVDWRPRRKLLGVVALVCLFEAATLVAYVAAAPGFLTEPRYLVYPFLWLNAAGLAVVWVSPPSASSRRKGMAAVVGGGYFLVLAAVDGTIALAPAAGVEIYWGLPPGWGPMVVADVGPFRLASVPYRVLGYAAVAYLVSVALLDASSRAVGGLVGLFACASCTLPVLAAALSGIAGGAGAAVATSWSYDFSTAVFLATLAVLVGEQGRS